MSIPEALTTEQAAQEWAMAKQTLEEAEAALQAAQVRHAEARAKEAEAWEFLERRARRWPPDSGTAVAIRVPAPAHGNGYTFDDGFKR